MENGKAVNKLSKTILRINFLILIVFVGFFYKTQAAQAQTSKPRPKTTCSTIINGATALIVKDSKGRILFSKNPDKYCVPASTIKVLTAFTALKVLGAEYRYHTMFYEDAEGNLKVKGFGDPFITSEVIDKMAEQIALTKKKFAKIILDDSYFESDIYISGNENNFRLYEAPVGALCANFNSASIIYKNGKYYSGDPDTPLIPYIISAAEKYHVKNGRFLAAPYQSETPYYFGHLLHYFLRKYGVQIGQTIEKGTIKKGDRLILNFESPHDLEFIIKEMMKYSNNFIANQLFLTAGAKMFGPPANIHKGVECVKRIASQYLDMTDIYLVEGSGLSRENKLTANQLLKLLKAFEPYAHLLKEKNNVLYKTGTLKGVSNRIGFMSLEGKNYTFVILRNGNGPTSAAVLECLKRRLSSTSTPSKRKKGV